MYALLIGSPLLRFGELSDKLQVLREIRLALLDSDVHFKAVKQFIERVRENATGDRVLTALSPGQQVVKIVRDELAKVLRRR